MILYPKTNSETKPLTTHSNETQSCLPGVDLSDLLVDRREKVKQVLISECGALAKDKNDVGKIDSLKLELNLSDNTPVNKPCRSIPKNLCSEVKHYRRTTYKPVDL